MQDALQDTRTHLQQGKAAQVEVAALRETAAHQDQQHKTLAAHHQQLLAQHQQLQETALALQAKLAAADAVAAADAFLNGRLIPSLALQLAAVATTVQQQPQAAGAFCMSSAVQEDHKGMHG